MPAQSDIARARDAAVFGFMSLHGIPRATYLARGSAADVWSVTNQVDRSLPTIYISKALRVSANNFSDSFMEDAQGYEAQSPSEDQHWRRFARMYRSQVSQWEGLRHANVIRIYHNADNLNLSVEYCSRGSVREASRLYIESGPSYMIPKREIIYAVLNGLNYLHGLDPPVIHGNLNAGKIFVNEQNEIKIGEFGLAAFCYHAAPLLPSVMFTGFSRWMSPELLDLNPDADEVPEPTIHSDIWALGCTIYEIISEKLPYSKYKHDIKIQRAILNGELPGDSAFLSSTINPADSHWQALCRLSWSQLPLNRPTIGMLIDSGYGANTRQATAYIRTPEVWINILEFLPVPDIIRCRLVSRNIKHVVDDTARIQYRVELFATGHVDGGIHNPLSTADRLAQLREIDRGWRTLEWKSHHFYPWNGDYPTYELGGGVFARGRSTLPDAGQLDMDDVHHFTAAIDVIVFPSRDGTQPPPGWSHERVGILVQDFTIAPEEDLVVLVEHRREGAVAEPIRIHLRTLSSNKPHPMATLPVLFAHPQPPDVSISDFTIQIYNSLLGILFWGSHAFHLMIWDWCAGEIMVDYPAPAGIHFDDFSFLSDSSFLIPSSSAAGTAFRVYSFAHLLPTSHPSYESLYKSNQPSRPFADFPIGQAPHHLEFDNSGQRVAHTHWTPQRPGLGVTIRSSDTGDYASGASQQHRPNDASPAGQSGLTRHPLLRSLLRFPKPKREWNVGIMTCRVGPLPGYGQRWHTEGEKTRIVPCRAFYADPDRAVMALSSGLVPVSPGAFAGVVHLDEEHDATIGEEGEEVAATAAAYSHNLQPNQLINPPDPTAPLPPSLPQPQPQQVQVDDPPDDLDRLYFNLFVHIHALRRFAEPESETEKKKKKDNEKGMKGTHRPRVYEWNDWAPPITRLLTRMPMPAWACISHGQRFATLGAPGDGVEEAPQPQPHPLLPAPPTLANQLNHPVQQPPELVEDPGIPDGGPGGASLKRPIRVLDFNPYSVQRRSDEQDRTGNMVRVVDGPSVLKAGNYWESDVVSCLPYREVVTREELLLSGVMIDGERVLGMRSDERGNVSEMHVMQV